MTKDDEEIFNEEKSLQNYTHDDRIDSNEVD